MSKIGGVTGVEVDLETGEVTITSAEPIEDSEFRAAVDEAGFDVVG